MEITDLSEHGKNLIKHYEKFVPYKYDDGVGVMTIGWGHAIKPGESFPGRITEAEADAIFDKDLQFVRDAIKKYVTVPLNQNQYDSVASFIFNVGVGAFRESTLLRLLNGCNYEGAKEQFLRWNKGRVKGQLVELKGLTKRRTAEADLFALDTSIRDPLSQLNLA